LENISEQQMREMIFSGKDDTRRQFAEAFSPEIDKFIGAITLVFDRFVELEGRLPVEERPAWVEMFLYAAFNSLLTSFHLLISGVTVPAGNLMRSWSEAIAMALLCSDERIKAFAALKTNPRRFPVHKALDMVKQEKNALILDINKSGWGSFQRISTFFNDYSHSSVFSLANMTILSQPGSLVPLGSGFDADKVGNYRKEIVLRIRACKVMIDTLKVVEMHLTGRNPG
jgi:hypothetical protein